MTYFIYDGLTGTTREATTEEAAEFDARKNAPPPVPEILSARQFRLALNHFSMRAQADTFVAAADQDTKDWYEFATQFERHHPRVLAAMQALGITDAQADAVWTFGAGL